MSVMMTRQAPARISQAPEKGIHRAEILCFHQGLLQKPAGPVADPGRRLLDDDYNYFTS